MKTKTKNHLENLKNHEYAKKHRQKIIMRTVKHLIYLENNENASGENKYLHQRNIETEKLNLIVILNSKPEEITWY
jgi:hypothetical protein